MVRASGAIGSRWRNLWYRALGMRLEGYAWLRAIEVQRQWGDVTLGSSVALDHGVVLLCSGTPKRDKLVIKTGTYVNRYTIFDAHEHLEIGAGCMIGPHCFFTDGNHRIALSSAIKEQPMHTKPVVVEDDVWIGAGVCVLPGVRIAQGAVVGAGAVITKDVEPFQIVAGVPAKMIGMRK